MLLELKIENFGIIDDLRLRLGPGLNAITGETGSGKSLILQALDALLGGRTGPGIVRSGAVKASIEGLFDTGNLKALREWLAAQGFPSEDHFLVLHRDISADGKTKASINGIPAALSSLRSISGQLLEIHGQNEHQRILDPDNHLDCVDIFAKTLSVREQVAELFHKYSAVKKRIKAVALEAGDRERRLDFLKYSLDEIENFEPLQGEFEELEQKKALIQNSGKLFRDLSLAYSILREEEGSVLDRLVTLETSLDLHGSIHPGLESQLSFLKEAAIHLENFSDFLRTEKEKMQFSPEQLEDIEDRLAGYRKLHKKYGGNTEAVLSMQEEFLKEMTSIEMSDEETDMLRAELKKNYAALKELSEDLSRKRRGVLPELEKKIGEELAELGMPGAAVSISVKRELNNDDIGETQSDSGRDVPAGSSDSTQGSGKYLINEKGLDRVEFYLRSNAGEAFYPLRKIASGGEMSRIVLALKSIFVESRSAVTVLFDEIDAGVGGEVAHSIGGRLRKLSKEGQVLVVTHLHQVAGMAEHHFRIQKIMKDGRTVTSAARLAGDTRIMEMARMLGGENPGRIVLEHARELLSRTG